MSEKKNVMSLNIARSIIFQSQERKTTGEIIDYQKNNPPVI